jgi:hypothetical protein
VCVHVGKSTYYPSSTLCCTALSCPVTRTGIDVYSIRKIEACTAPSGHAIRNCAGYNCEVSDTNKIERGTVKSGIGFDLEGRGDGSVEVEGKQELPQLNTSEKSRDDNIVLTDKSQTSLFKIDSFQCIEYDHHLILYIS